MTDTKLFLLTRLDASVLGLGYSPFGPEFTGCDKTCLLLVEHCRAATVKATLRHVPT